jgi:hypothetical protein
LEQATPKQWWALQQLPFLSIQDTKYDPYKPATPFDTLLVPIHMLLQSL